MTVATPSPVSRAVAARLHALEQQVAFLQAAVDALMVRRTSGPRDRYDDALIHVLAGASRGLPFTVNGLWRRRAVDPALADALLDCDIDSTKQLGKLLRRLAEHTIDGARVRRIGTNREGAIWRVLQE